MTAGNPNYQILYPQQGVILLDGGLNNKYEKSLIPDNDSPDCLNVVFTNASVGTRGGSSILNTTSVGTFACDGIYTRRDQTGAETMIAFHGGSMRAWNTNTFVSIPSGMSVFTAGQRIGTAQYLNKMFIGDGGVIPYKYDGSVFTRHGVYSPTNSASYITGGVGLVTGLIAYKVTFLNTFLAESDVSTAVTLTSLTASSVVSITCLPTAAQSWGVNGRRLYRSDNGAAYKLVTTISDNSTTSYTDNTANASLTTAAPTDNGVPPNWSICFYHSNRLFVNDPANQNYVWYSALGAPYTFPSTNFFKIGDAASDLVKGFSQFDTSLVIFCETTTWLNYMTSTDDTTWRQIRARSPYGSLSPFGSFKWQDKIGFLAFQNTKFSGIGALAGAGYPSMPGASIDPSATSLTVSVAGSDLISDKIEPDIFNFQEAYMKNASAIIFKNKAYIAVTYGSNNTTNNRIYQFDFSRTDLSLQQAFTWGPFTGLNAAQFTILGGLLYYGSSTTDGFVYQMETSSYIDNTTAINSYFWTKEFAGNLGHENYVKDFRRIRFLADLPGNYYMNLTVLVDSDSGQGNIQQILLNPGAPLWGTLQWGAGSWGGGKNQYEFDISLGQISGKRVQFKFDNQNIVNQRFKVHRMNIVYNIRGIA